MTMAERMASVETEVKQGFVDVKADINEMKIVNTANQLELKTLIEKGLAGKADKWVQDGAKYLMGAATLGVFAGFFYWVFVVVIGHAR